MKGYVLAIAATVLIYLIYKIGQHITATYRHVEEENLLDFWNGRLQKNDAEAYRRTVAHLGSCEKCKQRLDTITQQNKTRYGIDSKMISKRFDA